MAKPRKPAQSTGTEKPAKEDGRITFVRLGEKRLASVLKRIAIMRNVARYPHSDKQAAKVMSLIDAAVEDLRTSFGPKSEIPSQISLTDE